jgi:hypothetical protein
MDNAVYKLTESTLSAWNNKKYVAGVFCDLTKAFNFVNHELLINKLQFYGVRGVFLERFRSFLFDRKQRVKMILINTITDSCNWKIIKHGVPQGSVLGSLLIYR